MLMARPSTSFRSTPPSASALLNAWAASRMGVSVGAFEKRLCRRRRWRCGCGWSSREEVAQLHLLHLARGGDGQLRALGEAKNMRHLEAGQPLAAEDAQRLGRDVASLLQHDDGGQDLLTPRI